MIWWQIIVSGIFTLAGSAIGAWLAGKYAVNSVKKQLKYDKNSKRMDKIQSYLKINALFLSHLRNCLSNANKLYDSVAEDDRKHGVFQKGTIEHAKNCDRIFIQADSEIEKLNLTVIPYEYYYDYIAGKELIKSIIPNFEGLINALNKPVKTDYIYFSNFYKNFEKDI